MTSSPAWVTKNQLLQQWDKFLKTGSTRPFWNGWVYDVIKKHLNISLILGQRKVVKFSKKLNHKFFWSASRCSHETTQTFKKFSLLLEQSDLEITNLTRF